MQRFVDFAPLIRLADYSWFEVEDILWYRDYDQTSIVRPTMTDYIALNPKLRKILYELTFPPTIYKIDVENRRLSVHLGAARQMADTLELDFSDRCIDILWENMLSQAEIRGEKMRDPSAIENLKHRSELLIGIKDSIDSLEDCSSSIDMRYQYLKYVETTLEEIMTEDEYKESIVSECLNLIKEVLRLEEQCVTRQFERACQNLK